MIIDEATSNMDKKNEEIIEKVMNKVFINQTSIVIAHKLSSLLNKNFIIIIDNGKIIE